MAKRTLTTAALVAKAIRKDLKAAGITGASVRSSNYAGGHSVRVELVNAHPKLRAEVQATLEERYTSGHFDGMSDAYIVTRRDDSPRVNFVFVEVTYTDGRQERAYAALREHLGKEGADLPESFNDARFRETSLFCDVGTMVHRMLCGSEIPEFARSLKPRVRVAA